MTRTRVAGLFVVAGGVAAIQAGLRWLGDARAWGDLSGVTYAIMLFLLLAAGLPVMAGGIYLVHKGRIDDAQS